MKRIHFIVIILISSAPVFAEGFYVKPALNFTVGFGDMYIYHEDNVNPGIGYFNIFGYDITESLALEGTVGFSRFQPFKNDEYGQHVTYYEIPFYAGVNYRLLEFLGLIGGVGMTYWYIGGNVDESDIDFAFYLGTEFYLRRFFIRPYFQFIDTPGDSAISINLSLGYKFGG